jgi:hypothetical protein
MSGPLTPDDLGRVERLDPRLVWGHEARHFTPWLAEHIGELAAAIGGLDLQLEATEQAVGDFAADLFGTDLTTGAAFVVENQLAETDHGHLGQIVTYAAGLDTRVMVWVAPRIRDEHRQAIDWLNEISREEYSFFAVRVELLRIGDAVAPDFVVVAGPNAWQKRVRGRRDGVSGQAGARGEVYREIWSTVIERLRTIDARIPPASPQPLNWLRLRGGDVFMTFSNQGPRVEMYLDADDANDIYERLHTRRNEVEAVLGELSWESLPGRRACRIARYTTGAWDAIGAERERIVEWLVTEALRFRKDFQPIVDDARRHHPSAKPPSDDAGGAGVGDAAVL